MRWKGKNLRPYGPIITNKQEFNYEQALKPLGEKLHEVPVWQPVLANIYKEPEVGPQPTPSITPSNTPTPSITPSLTPSMTASPTPSLTASPTNTPTPSITASVTPQPTTTPTNTPTPSASPVQSGTTEANAFLEAAAVAKGSALGSTISAATVTLFTSLVSNNLWDKLAVFYPIVGGNSASTAVNGKNPGTYTMSWNGGVSFTANEVTGNGTNAYGNTNFNITALTLNSVHISNYSRTSPSRSNIDMGIAIAGGDAFQIYNYETTATGIKVVRSNADGYSTGAVANGQGLFTATRTGSTIETAFRNATRTINASKTSTALSNENMFVMARNGGSGVAGAFNARGYAWFSVGYGLSDVDVSNYYTIIQAFQTALSRQV
jgi:hypothetical protein